MQTILLIDDDIMEFRLIKNMLDRYSSSGW